jgi:hypothetical protein
MRMLRYLTYPYALMISFLMIIISGEHFGGFYVLYILLALPHGGLHGILAIIGIGLLFLTGSKSKNIGVYKNIAGLLAATCLLLSLFVFFHNDRDGYNDGTFHQAIPLFSILLFASIWLAFTISLIIDISAFKRKRVAS